MFGVFQLLQGIFVPSGTRRNFAINLKQIYII